VRFVEQCTKTIHYAPIGDQDTWEIGEPYIPMNVLQPPRPPWPDQLHIAVLWE
jgi:hypothetical protein